MPKRFLSSKFEKFINWLSPAPQPVERTVFRELMWMSRVVGKGHKKGSVHFLEYGEWTIHFNGEPLEISHRNINRVLQPGDTIHVRVEVGETTWTFEEAIKGETNHEQNGRTNHRCAAGKH